MPATRKGRTNQLGIRRLRKSVKVATERTINVGHQANECIQKAPLALVNSGNTGVSAIVQPNPVRAKCFNFRQLTLWERLRCTRVFTDWAEEWIEAYTPFDRLFRWAPKPFWGTREANPEWAQSRIDALPCLCCSSL